MLKVLLVIILVGYVFVKASSFVFNILFGGLKNQQNSQFGRRRSTGDINVVNKSADKNKSNKNFKGGEYIDYEEVDSKS